jgi:hypothetical protein
LRLKGDCHCGHDQEDCPSPPHRQTGHNGIGVRSCYHGPCRILRQYDSQYHVLPTYLVENQSGYVSVFTSAELNG